jgi:hypothetical protein
MVGRAALLLVLGACYCAPARADVLNIGSKTQNGILEGYDGRSFQFRDEKTGKVQAISRTSVKDLKLDKPRKAEVEVMGKKKTETMLMAGYAKGTFLFINQGEKTTISGMNVKNIKLEYVSQFGRPSDPVPESVQQISDADINRLLGQPDLRDDQKAALKQYQEARNKHRQFVAESSAMVAKMDTLTGSERQATLNKLRLRKEAEQPLKRDLEASQQALTAAFPEL